MIILSQCNWIDFTCCCPYIDWGNIYTYWEHQRHQSECPKSIFSIFHPTSRMFRALLMCQIFSSILQVRLWLRIPFDKSSVVCRRVWHPTSNSLRDNLHVELILYQQQHTQCSLLNAYLFVDSSLIKSEHLNPTVVVCAPCWFPSRTTSCWFSYLSTLKL